ncbi:hypothetical protein [Streptomyces sp. KL118A]|uniref:hypothetical protein n=1 Tax=Streptomyces sp. KL118A TaxID=3045153 RepID=UPI00278C3246|nr:hypothetical protein [Streptomyces sp. KL118A]
MLSLWSWHQLQLMKARDFFEPDMDIIYERTVDDAVNDPSTEQLLRAHSGVTKPDLEQDLLAPLFKDFTISRCPDVELQTFERAGEALADIEEQRRRARSEAAWDWRVACSLLAVAALAVLLFGNLLWLGAAVVTVAALLSVLGWCGAAVSGHVLQSFKEAALAVSWAVQRVEVGVRAVRWGKVLLKEGILPAVPHVVRRLVGDEPDSMFLPDRSSGLRTPRSAAHVVDTRAMLQLERKLGQVEYGTIAVCGPRGSGKTTLLEQCVGDAELGLLAQAPATYAPHDFLLSLSVRLCETYLSGEGYDVPEFTRLSPTRRLLRRARSRLRKLGRWSVFAVPAAALLALGLYAPARSLYTQHADSIGDTGRERGDVLRDGVVDIWQGHAVVASLCVTLAGLVWWQSRHAAWLPRLIRESWRRTGRGLGHLLQCLAALSLVLDEQIMRLDLDIGPQTLATAGLLALAWRVCVACRDSGVEFDLGRWHISLRRLFQPLAALGAFGLVLYVVDNPEIRPLLADEDNPLRMAVFMVGLALVGVGRWEPRLEEPELVTRCRNHLYRLQTIQMSGNTFNATGPAQVLTLGGSHATSVTTVPPTYPELVDSFRDLLTQIAWALHLRNTGRARDASRTVVIAIDEVDRLGSDTEALAFLGEIKAVLGVPYVYYLISVAEDVGATFVRRGLPHRGVTDSSLDDIVHVQPSTLEESRTLLAVRTDRLTEPYVRLAHALSGGILRDLMRYGIQISEMQEKSQSHELTDISRHLVLEELSETLAGFRTLLSKHQWTPETRTILSRFGTLVTCLNDPEPCPCTQAKLQTTLEEFAFGRADDDLQSALAGQLTTEAVQLIDEASAYAYFSLTLLDIFAARHFSQRATDAAVRGEGGEPERLAQARQELGISAYSARPLIDTIRVAWSLPLATADSRRIPRQSPCTMHARQVPHLPGAPTR